MLRQTVLSNFPQNMWQRLLSLLLTITFLSFFISLPAKAQVDKLAKVYSITQDSNGFIWLAGHQGLTRFDGTNSITFSANDPNWLLPFTWTHEIEPYGDKFIVASESSGTWLFNPNDGQFEQLNIHTERASHYHSIEFQGNYYISSDKQVYKYDTKANLTSSIFTGLAPANLVKTPTHLYINAGYTGAYVLNGNKFTQLISEKINTIAAVGSHVIVVSPTKIYTLSGDKIIASIPVVSVIHGIAKENQQDNFFTIANDGEIKRYKAENLAELPHSYEHANKGRVKAAYHDRSNVLWLATNLGIQRLVESSLKNHPVTFEVANNSNEISVFSDELVIGSFGQGIHAFSPESRVFPANINDDFTPNAKRVMDLQPVGDDLFIATFDGLWQFNAKSKQLKRVPFANNNKLLIKLAHYDGLLYIGSNFDGLYIYDIENQSIIDHLNKDKGLISTEIIDILPFDNGDIWLASTKSISIYNRFSKYIKNVPNLGPNKVVSLEFAQNKVFAGTLGDGINILDRQGTLLSVIAQGIEFTYSSIIKGKIWIGSAVGLYTIDPVTHEVALIPSTEKFSFSDAARLVGDSVFYAHFGGILEVPIEQRKIYNSNVYIGKTIVSGRQHLQNQEINISSVNDVVSFDLVSLDYRPGQAKKFKYKLNNGSWNHINGNQLTLTGLAPGGYNIEIMATNSLGQWSEKRAYANINVAYPWYWTLQARIVYGVTLVCLIALFAWTFYLRTQSIRKIYLLLETEVQRKGKSALSTKRHLQSIVTLLNENEQTQAIEIAEQCIEQFASEESEETPDALYGSSLNIAVPYFADFLHRKYHVKMLFDLYPAHEQLSYELQANIYKLIYEAVTCAVLHGESCYFQLTLKEFNDKLWLTISDEKDSFSHFNNKVTFNMSMYYIRQIANKYKASVNTFEPTDDKGSQIVISFPLRLNR